MEANWKKKLKVLLFDSGQTVIIKNQNTLWVSTWWLGWENKTEDLVLFGSSTHLSWIFQHDIYMKMQMHLLHIQNRAKIFFLHWTLHCSKEKDTTCHHISILVFILLHSPKALWVSETGHEERGVQEPEEETQSEHWILPPNSKLVVWTLDADQFIKWIAMCTQLLLCLLPAGKVTCVAEMFCSTVGSTALENIKQSLTLGSVFEVPTEVKNNSKKNELENTHEDISALIPWKKLHP